MHCDLSDFFPKKQSIHRHHFEVGVTKKLLEEGQGAHREMGLVPFDRLIAIGMCHWMVSQSHDWVDYNGLHFQYRLREWACTFSGFWGKKRLSSRVLLWKDSR